MNIHTCKFIRHELFSHIGNFSQLWVVALDINSLGHSKSLDLHKTVRSKYSPFQLIWNFFNLSVNMVTIFQHSVICIIDRVM